MRNALLLLPAALALQACVYSSPVPLADPSEAVFDEALLGTWLAVEDTGELLTVADTQGALIHVARDTGNGYAVSHRRDGEDDHGHVYVVALEGVRFLTIIDDDGDGPVYSFARYTLEGDRLTVRFIANRGAGEERGLTGTFATSAELQEAVRARLHDPLLYEEDEVLLVRQPAGPARR